MENQGRYIVLEGPPGVGKSTHLAELARRLRADGRAVQIFSDPDSQSDMTAATIRRMINDPRYPMNTRTEVLLYNAIRSQSIPTIKALPEKGVTCLSERSFLSTLTRQFYGASEARDYYSINNIIDFATGGFGPDLIIVLDAPTDVLVKRLNGKLITDPIPPDAAYLERVRAGYLWEAKQRNYPVVFATRPFDEVADEIWKLANSPLASGGRALLANEPATIKQSVDNKDSKPAPEDTNQPLLEKLANGSNKITDAGKAWLGESVTSVHGNVYAIKPALSSATVAAAMARFSRRGGDLRITILDEFVGKDDKDEQLLRQAITDFGDDSVGQLAGQYIVIENASSLLAKKLERGRLSAYLEPSIRSIDFEQKDASGHYKYYLPPQFKAPVLKKYTSAMDQIFGLYSEMLEKLINFIGANDKTPKNRQDDFWKNEIRSQARDALKPILPVATKSTVGIFADAQSLESLIIRLLADDLPEARQAGQEILDEAKKIIPIFLDQTDKPERGGARIAYLASTRRTVVKLAQKYLPPSHTAINMSGANLVDYHPKNELDIVADILFEHSDDSLENLKKLASGWSYAKKAKILDAYCGERLNRRHKPGRALEKVHYSWEVVCDYEVFRVLQRHRMVDDLGYQALTPRYGYDIPEIIEKVELIDRFERCFDISLKLYSQLQAAGYPLEAQYATLFGHRMRWKVTYNAREAFHIHELHTHPHGRPECRALVREMHEKIMEVHPLLAKQMIFVNQTEDPELATLAAKRTAAYKTKET